MADHFALDTLRIRIADPALAPLELRVRVQRALRQMILDGVLPPGCRLPATRAAAHALGMSRDTVEMAYAQLQLDGYLSRRKGSGSFVSDRLGPGLRGARPPRGGAPAAPHPRADAPAALSARGAAILAGGGVSD